MDRKPYICIPMALSAHLCREADLHVVQENLADVLAPGDGSLELAVASGKKWENGRSLHISFIGGAPKVRRYVIEAATEWTRYANLHFDFGDYPDAEIRISFANEGSYSAIGKDALDPDFTGKRTMNLEWNPYAPVEDFKATVLHEFGHAIGCIHEHSVPGNGIQWNRPAVYAYCAALNPPWTKAMVDYNIFDTFSEPLTNSTFDPTSIMIYPIPKAWTLDGYEVKWNTQLSAQDKAFIAQVYPRA